jgi:3'-phosphoadenosine 5'-phosphosulfate sulfotransferase (PAPS reductase)/FAD synthetase
MKTVSWFSAGVSSAVATKLALAHIDEIIYIHIEDHHPDTLRFVADCERWFGKPIQTVQSPYLSVGNALKASGGFVNGPYGAPCTKFLKRRVRKEWELKQDSKLRYVWGFDINESGRAANIEASMPDQKHIFPLIDHMMTKEEAHKILTASGIKRPAMYDLGYHNNNCVGCVKGGMGYWNKIRVDFPDVFAARAKLERTIGGSCINGVYLDELDPERGRHEGPIVDDCGIFCEIMEIR